MVCEKGRTFCIADVETKHIVPTDFFSGKLRKTLVNLMRAKHRGIGIVDLV